MSNNHSDRIESLALVFKALSNPQRLRMFLRLAADCSDGKCCEGEREDIRRCVGELGEDLGLAASTVSHHLKELRMAGLLNVRRRGQRIECWLDVRMLAELTGFMDSLGAPVSGEVRRGCGEEASDVI